MTTATHNQHDPTPERVLFMAFALREKTWKLGFTTGHGQQPRERMVAARHQARLLLPEDATRFVDAVARQDPFQAEERIGVVGCGFSGEDKRYPTEGSSHGEGTNRGTGR